MRAIDTIKHNGHTIEIHHDMDCSSPRENCNLGTILCVKHRSYNLGDKIAEVEEMQRILKDTKNYIALPVYMYEHGNVALSTSAFSCQWDSGQLGIIYVEKSKVLKEYSVKRVSPKILKNVLACLKSEIEEYGKYINGECYGFIIRDASGREVDSCWGHIGMDWAIQSAKENCPEAPNFTVRLIAETTVYADVPVKANSKEEAEEKALEEARAGNVRYELSEGNTLQWEVEGE